MHWFTQHFAVALLRGYDWQDSLSNGSAPGMLVAAGRAGTCGGQGDSDPRSCHRHCPSHKLPWDTNLQWQLLPLLMFHPCLPTATWPFYWTHSTLPTHWDSFPGICLDLRYMLIYYAESQTFSCSKKCHFTSPRVLPHYHFNKKQEQGFEVIPPINSTLLSLASQPTTASVHSTTCLLDERKAKRWPSLMDHYAKHPNKAHYSLSSTDFSLLIRSYKPHHVLAQKEL